MNYDSCDNIITTGRASHELEFIKEPVEFTKEFVKEPVEFAKEPVEFAKEFVKASRQIYKLISQNPHISAIQMSESMELSPRQIQKYLRRLQ